MTLGEIIPRKVGILAACSLFALGILVPIAAEWWWNSAQPNRLIITGIETSRTFDGGYILVVHTVGRKSPGCLRLSQFMIYRNDDSIGKYIPLGVSIGGLQFSSTGALVDDSAGRGKDIDILLKIDPGAAGAGKWKYVTRSAFICTIFPGLTRVHHDESDPVPFTLTEAATYRTSRSG